MKNFIKKNYVGFLIGLSSLVFMWAVWVIAQITVKNEYVIPSFSDTVKALLDLAQLDDLMTREKTIDGVRFMWLQLFTEFDFFSAEMVFAYYLEALMLHRWSILTVEEGEKVFRALVADMKKGIKLD